MYAAFTTGSELKLSRNLTNFSSENAAQWTLSVLNAQLGTQVLFNPTKIPDGFEFQITENGRPINLSQTGDYQLTPGDHDLRIMLRPADREPKQSVFQVHQNYPNPFNPETWIPYQLAGDVDAITIEIHNASGELIRTLNLGSKASGFYFSRDRAAHWNGQNEHGETVSSGIYFYTLSAGSSRETRKLILLK